MFRKLVSNLPFTPSLINQIGFYAQRLSRENATRRLVVIFSIMTIAVQAIAVMAPPESSVATSYNDLIYGGLPGNDPQGLLLKYYDVDGDWAGHTNLRGIFSYWGITRNDLANTNVETIKGGPTPIGEWYSMGRTSHPGDIDTIDIAGGPIYLRPLGVWGIGAKHRALVGRRASDGWGFAVLIDCGNLELFNVPPPPKTPAPAPPPSPTPKPNPVPAKQVRNLSKPPESKQFVNANNTTVRAGDTLEYTVSIFNAGEGAATGTLMKDNLNDVLEYADLIEKDGGALTNGVLSWPVADIAPKQTLKHTFRVKLKDPVPSTPTAKSDPLSYDLCLDNVFMGKDTRVCVNIPPPPKIVERTSRQLPNTGPGFNLMLTAVLGSVSGFFFLRNRQLLKEVVILKRQQGSGA